VVPIGVIGFGQEGGGGGGRKRKTWLMSPGGLFRLVSSRMCVVFLINFSFSAHLELYIGLYKVCIIYIRTKKEGGGSNCLGVYYCGSQYENPY
jgi:hypothetical protein